MENGQLTIRDNLPRYLFPVQSLFQKKKQARSRVEAGLTGCMD